MAFLRQMPRVAGAEAYSPVPQGAGHGVAVASVPSGGLRHSHPGKGNDTMGIVSDGKSDKNGILSHADPLEPICNQNAFSPCGEGGRNGRMRENYSLRPMPLTPHLPLRCTFSSASRGHFAGSDRLHFAGSTSRGQTD